MQSTDWPPEHSDAIREYYAKGMSYLQIAKAINANFNTRYSRNAVLGRSKRLGLGGCNGPADLPEPGPVDWSSSKPAIAAIPMAATRTAKPSPIAATRAAKIQAIAARIFV